MAYTTINKSSDYFNTKLWTGNATDNTTISGVGFQPDFTWIKERSSISSHHLQDSVRGATKALISNSTGAENISSTRLKSWNSDGFVIGTSGAVNASSDTYASWNWLANGTGSANTDGSISSTVSANITSGFSIVSYTGNGSANTVGHGLGSAPGLIIVKNLTTSGRQWQILHHKNTAAPATQQLEFGTDGTATVTSQWNSVMPTASVFTIGTNDSTNKNGDSFIAYCFADVQGYSKFGKYIGTGSNFDNAFVYTGFKPAFIMIKRTDYEPFNWFIQDSKRAGYNQANYHLYPNLTNVEGTTYYTDFLSNGFKIRDNGGDFGASGATYIYMAVAEAPLVGTNNVPCTAR
jgi:hypothetical protein